MNKDMNEHTEEQERAANAALKLSLESTQEFFDMWMKNYQYTFGKLFQMPAIGPVRERQEKLMKSFPLYTNLYTTWIESNINFQNVFMEAMRRTYEKSMNDIKHGEGDINSENSEKYKEFYKIWLDTYSDTFKEFLKSGHYLSDMNRIMSNFMDFQKYNREMIEENFLRPGNLPTKTDIDEINKELYSLKKAIKSLEQQLRQSTDKNDKNNEVGKEIKTEKKEIS